MTGREQVAQIKGRAVYALTGVSLIPLSSQREAQREIDKYVTSSKKTQTSSPSGTPNDLTDDEGILSGNVTADDEENGNLVSAEDSLAVSRKNSKEESSSVAQDVFRRRGQYGRFAERWFSKKGWASDKRRISVSLQDRPSDELKPTQDLSAQPSEQSAKTTEAVAADGAVERCAVPSLLPKLLRTTKMILSSRSFYFSYDHDLTHRLGTGSDSSTDIPLYKRVDRLVRVTVQNMLLADLVSSSGIAH